MDLGRVMGEAGQVSPLVEEALARAEEVLVGPPMAEVALVQIEEEVDLARIKIEVNLAKIKNKVTLVKMEVNLAKAAGGVALAQIRAGEDPEEAEAEEGLARVRVEEALAKETLVPVRGQKSLAGTLARAARIRAGMSSTRTKTPRSLALTMTKGDLAQVGSGEAVASGMAGVISTRQTLTKTKVQTFGKVAEMAPEKTRGAAVRG